MSTREIKEGTDDQVSVSLDSPEGLQLFAESVRAESRGRYEKLMDLKQAGVLTLTQGYELEDLTRLHGTDEEKISRMTMIEAIQAGLAE